MTPDDGAAITTPDDGVAITTPCGSMAMFDGAAAEIAGAGAHDAGADATNCDADVRACHVATRSSMASAPPRLARKVFTAILLDWGALPVRCSRKMPAEFHQKVTEFPAVCLPSRSSVSPRGVFRSPLNAPYLLHILFAPFAS